MQRAFADFAECLTRLLCRFGGAVSIEGRYGMQGGPEPSLQTFGVLHSWHRFRPLRCNHNHIMCCCRQRNRRHRLGVHLLPQLRSKRCFLDLVSLAVPANLNASPPGVWDGRLETDRRSPSDCDGYSGRLHPQRSFSPPSACSVHILPSCFHLSRPIGILTGCVGRQLVVDSA